LVPTVGVKGSGRPERLQIVGLRRHHERCLPVVYCCCCWCCCRGTPRSRGGRCCFWSMLVVGVAPSSSTLPVNRAKIGGGKGCGFTGL
jgi:hypothetical protein